MKTKFYQGKVLVKASGEGITVVASDETLDRHGDVLPVDQWDLTKFMMSPRMLVDHNHEVASIVGKWKNIRIEGGKLLMDADFHAITELSNAVKEMVEKNYLDTVSVGFIPHAPAGDGQKDSFELIECSWVTVPANPNARVLKELMDKTIKKESVEEIVDYLGSIEAEDDFEEEEEKINDVVTSVEQFKALADSTEVVACTYALLKSLIADSEKLMTLTDAEQEKGRKLLKEKRAKTFLKELARNINHSLQELNKVE